MSNAVYPIGLPGLQPAATVAPRFSTRIQSAVSGRETRAAFMAYPLWDVSLAYEFLRATAAAPELDTLAGFFLQMRGSWDNFLVAVPNDNAVTDMAFGTGNGASAAFQLTRTRGAGGFGFVEPVQNLNVLGAVKVAGVTKTLGTDYTVSGAGLVTFATPPAAGAALTWSGSYYYRCRFLHDQADFSRFLNDLWELKKVQMVGAPGNKV